jgi:periplasmic protein CpxP/Spy
MIKRCLLTLTLIGVISTLTIAGIAQDNQSSDQQTTAGSPHERGGREHFDPARRTEMLTKKLNLTADEQTKVLDILKSAESQAEGVRSDTSVPPQERRTKMMEIHKSSNQQIRGILDATQQKKFDAMQAKHEQWREHRENGQASPDSGEQK